MHRYWKPPSAGTIAHELYDDHLGEVASALRAFAVVNDFIATHGLSWTPPGAGRYSGDYDQHFGEMVEYLHRARVDWHDNPAIQTGLDRHTEPTMKLLDVWASDERERVKRDGPTF